MESDPERRRIGLETMSRVYGWEVTDGPGDYFHYTVEHLFGEIWQRPGLSNRDRRLLLLGLLVGTGGYDVIPLQIRGALAGEELDDDALREIVVFLAHYAGWPAGARLYTMVEEALGAQGATSRPQK